MNRHVSAAIALSVITGAVLLAGQAAQPAPGQQGQAQPAGGLGVVARPPPQVV